MIIDFLEKHDIPYEVNVFLSKKTWIKTGGICKYYIMPNSTVQLKELVTFLYLKKKSFDIVGATSNCFFTSNYSPDVVISTLRLNKIHETNRNIECECGVLTSTLARNCVNKGYKGFSGLVNLPGTVGAAIYGNAGCFGCSVSSLLEQISMLTYNTSLHKVEVKSLGKNDLAFSHRSSAFKRKEINGIILSVTLKKELSSVNSEIEKAQYATQRRKISQESPAKNLGSIYGKLIYRKNLKNFIALFIKTVLRLCHIANDGMTFYKHIQLKQYGYEILNRYISDKNINTFMWIDKDAETMFPIYQKFMEKVYLNPTLEIEIRQ